MRFFVPYFSPKYLAYSTTNRPTGWLYVTPCCADRNGNVTRCHRSGSMTVTDQRNREDANITFARARRFEMQNCRRGFRNKDRCAITRLRNYAGFIIIAVEWLFLFHAHESPCNARSLYILFLKPCSIEFKSVKCKLVIRDWNFLNFENIGVVCAPE